jgi:hypothetical protein
MPSSALGWIDRKQLDAVFFPFIQVKSSPFDIKFQMINARD